MWFAIEKQVIQNTLPLLVSVKALIIITLVRLNYTHKYNYKQNTKLVRFVQKCKLWQELRKLPIFSLMFWDVLTHGFYGHFYPTIFFYCITLDYVIYFLFGRGLSLYEFLILWGFCMCVFLIFFFCFILVLFYLFVLFHDGFLKREKEGM